MLLFVCLFLWLHRCTHSQYSSQDQDIYSKGFRFIFTFYCRRGHPHIDTYLPHNSVNTSGIGSSLILSASNLKNQCSRFSFSSFIVGKPSFIGHLKLKRCIVKNADLQFLSSHTQKGLQWVPGISLYQSGGTWYDFMPRQLPQIVETKAKCPQFDSRNESLRRQIHAINL